MPITSRVSFGRPTHTEGEPDGNRNAHTTHTHMLLSLLCVYYYVSDQKNTTHESRANENTDNLSSLFCAFNIETNNALGVYGVGRGREM